MSFLTHLSRVKRELEIRSMARSKQTEAQKLEKKLAKLSKIPPSEIQKKLITKQRLKYTGEKRELMEKYMKLEIRILEDIELRLQTKPPGIIKSSE